MFIIYTCDFINKMSQDLSRCFSDFNKTPPITAPLISRVDGDWPLAIGKLSIDHLVKVKDKKILLNYSMLCNYKLIYKCIVTATMSR